ncbi:MAG: M56 family metallopeptidase, partial [Clostridiales bacterium]|nr:M56 family metallopeptidase [Clostridiales bacterium]
MMIGLLSPTILLPKRKYDYDELRLILKHELTHFQHRDLWIKLLLIVCRAFHWFNPLMILFGRSIEKECEYYCDMAVMEREPESMRKVYCQSILNTLADQVQRQNSAFRPVLATSFYSPKTGLKHRFSMVLSGKKRMIVGILVLSVLLTVVSGFAFSGSRTNEVTESSAELVETTEWVEETEVFESSAYEEVTEWTETDDNEPIESSQEYVDDEGWVENTELDEVEETTATAIF